MTMADAERSVLQQALASNVLQPLLSGRCSMTFDELYEINITSPSSDELSERIPKRQGLQHLSKKIRTNDTLRKPSPVSSGNIETFLRIRSANFSRSYTPDLEENLHRP
jgi:hypothetical protein